MRKKKGFLGMRFLSMVGLGMLKIRIFRSRYRREYSFIIEILRRELQYW
jgi:hypothetical protein